LWFRFTVDELIDDGVGKLPQAPCSYAISERSAPVGLLRQQVNDPMGLVQKREGESRPILLAVVRGDVVELVLG
jgi:hypothetical protein